MSIKNLLKTWALPDRTQDRMQLTLRLNYDLYAKLHALKEVYPSRSINDMINDIIRSGLDEIIEALPSYPISAEEREKIAFHEGGSPDDYNDWQKGPASNFEAAYQRILNQKSENEGEAA